MKFHDENVKYLGQSANDASVKTITEGGGKKTLIQRGGVLYITSQMPVHRYGFYMPYNFVLIKHNNMCSIGQVDVNVQLTIKIQTFTYAQFYFIFVGGG